MAMCRQTVQRYGGFPIPAIVVRDAGEAFPVVTRDSPFRLHGRLYVYTDFVTAKNGISERHARKIYFSPEENIFSSGGKNYTPCGSLSGYTGYTVTWLHGGMLHLRISHQK